VDLNNPNSSSYDVFLLFYAPFGRFGAGLSFFPSFPCLVTNSLALVTPPLILFAMDHFWFIPDLIYIRQSYTNKLHSFLPCNFLTLSIYLMCITLILEATQATNNNNNNTNTTTTINNYTHIPPSNLSNIDAPRDWNSVMKLIPQSQLNRPGAAQQLSTLKMYYMGVQKSLANNNNNSAGSTSAAAENSKSSISQLDLNEPAAKELAELLKSLDASQYLNDLLAEEVTVEVIHLLELDELTLLIPKLGPRKRMEQWIKQRRIELGMPLQSYDRSNKTNASTNSSDGS
jgi:hypothetical protein